MNRVLPLTALLASLVPALASTSCAEKTDSESATSSAAQAVTAPSAPAPSGSGAQAARSPKHHPRAGIVGLFFSAAESLDDLTASQRAAIQGLEPHLQTRGDEQTARAALRSDLAAGIRAGTIDTAKIAADEASLEKIGLEARSARAAALGGLHDALGEADRKTVADDVRTKLQAAEARRSSSRAGEAGVNPWADRRLEHLTAQLGLDPSQQQQVATLLAKGKRSEPPAARKEAWEAGRRRIDALLAAFTEAAFDAGALPSPDGLGQNEGDAGKPPHDRAGHEVAFLQRLLPILTSEQREKLAAATEKPRGEWRGADDSPGESPDEGE